MMGLLADFMKSDGEPLPPRNELAAKAECVRAWWEDRAGTYGDTEHGVEDITFTELNERRAASRVSHFGWLRSRANRGTLTTDERDEIERAYKRLPREWRTA